MYSVFLSLTVVSPNFPPNFNIFSFQYLWTMFILLLELWVFRIFWGASPFPPHTISFLVSINAHAWAHHIPHSPFWKLFIQVLGSRCILSKGCDQILLRESNRCLWVYLMRGGAAWQRDCGCCWFGLAPASAVSVLSFCLKFCFLDFCWIDCKTCFGWLVFSSLRVCKFCFYLLVWAKVTFVF